MARVVWIGYTTQYREGGPAFAAAARTLAKRARLTGAVVHCLAVESKAAFAAEMAALAPGSLAELHFVGHSGMYGIMFGSVAHPEQFSPHEWRQLHIPFAPGGQAYFHACRTARWFAPFFARTYSVPAWGYHWYTTVSASAERYVPWRAAQGEAYIIGMIGRKSHGPMGSVLKRTGLARAEAMQRAEPQAMAEGASYDGIADLYATAYEDITVRKVEVAWLSAQLAAHAQALGRPLRVLDVGCGNGALLAHLAPSLREGLGVDISAGMLAQAARRTQGLAQLRFAKLDGPRVPAPDHSMDVVISLLSFRYLDWDPMMNEFRRVLRPGGRMLIVDMVAAPLGLRDVGGFVKSKHRVWRGRKAPFAAHLTQLVRDPRWQTMLAHNPMRARHEYVWYLQSRFPGRRVVTLDVGYHAQIVAFDSGALAPGMVAPQAYP